MTTRLIARPSVLVALAVSSFLFTACGNPASDGKDANDGMKGSTGSTGATGATGPTGDMNGDGGAAESVTYDLPDGMVAATFLVNGATISQCESGGTCGVTFAANQSSCEDAGTCTLEVMSAEVSTVSIQANVAGSVIPPVNANLSMGGHVTPASFSSVVIGDSSHPVSYVVHAVSSSETFSYSIYTAVASKSSDDSQLAQPVVVVKGLGWDRNVPGNVPTGAVMAGLKFAVSYTADDGTGVATATGSFSPDGSSVSYHIVFGDGTTSDSTGTRM